MFDVRVGVALNPQHARLAQPTLGIPGYRVLDLDHIGAPFGQHRTRGRDEPVHGDFENANAVKWRGHPTTPLAGIASVLRSRNSSSPATPISRPTPDCL